MLTRKVKISGITYLSVRDLIGSICVQNKKISAQTWRRIADNSSKLAELSEYINEHQFPGERESVGPVITLQGAIKLIMFLPGDNAEMFRAKAMKIVTRYTAGDSSLINEIQANAESQAPLNQMARESLAGAAGARVIQPSGGIDEASEGGDDAMETEMTTQLVTQQLRTLADDLSQGISSANQGISSANQGISEMQQEMTSFNTRAEEYERHIADLGMQLTERDNTIRSLLHKNNNQASMIAKLRCENDKLKGGFVHEIFTRLDNIDRKTSFTDLTQRSGRIEAGIGRVETVMQARLESSKNIEKIQMNTKRTIDKLKEDYLKCPICHEMYFDPVTLVTGSTYCRSCITRHINSVTIGGNKNVRDPVTNEQVAGEDWPDVIIWSNWIAKNITQDIRDGSFPGSFSADT